MRKFQVRLFYDKDQKNYHMNPVKTRKCFPVYLDADTFVKLVEEGLVYTR